MQAVTSTSVRADLAARTKETLAIIHRWGYAPSLEELAAEMLGGDVATEDLVERLPGISGVGLDDGFAYLPRYESLLDKSKGRHASNGALNGEARAIAKEFASDLVRICPLIDCVAVSGSVASGGYGSGDDIDFDLFVRRGSKYTCYLMATVIGLKFAWRYRGREMDELERTPLLPKITCVNVVWPEDQTQPFMRQDADLAFELLRCRPLYGARRFRSVLDGNPWLREYFPQVYDRPWTDEVSPQPSAVGRLMTAIGRRPRMLRMVEAASRGLAWMIYSFVQWTRRGNPAAVARMTFLRRAKWPYEVFQD